MSGRTFINIGGAILGGALAFFTFGASAVLMGAALGYTAAGIIQGPAAPPSGSMRPDELQVIQSSESATIPVTFGTTRLAGNFLFYDKDSFEAIPIYEEAEGGKGGGGSQKQKVGYEYKLSFEIGLCMGPVDGLMQIQGSPGMDLIDFYQITDFGGKPDDPKGFIDRDQWTKWMLYAAGKKQDNPTVPIDFETDEPIELSMKGTKDDSGRATFLPGGRTQDRYRDVCAVLFDKFLLGRQPAPRSYLFCLVRMPRPVDSDGLPIPGFAVNASADPEHAEFGDANPAAVVWEMLTNPVWGKGTDPDHLNAADFVRASQYFRDSRIGVSTAIGDDASSVQLVQRFRELFGLVTWWDGHQIRCRALWDRATAYQNRPRITPEDIIGDPALSRQSMSSATNEVRLTFNNRENNWQQEAATAQDLASIEQIGGVRSVKVDASEIATRRCAELVAHRMLRTMAYPPAICSVAVRRTFAHLQPGEFVELVVDGWRGEVMTTFWRVDSVDDDLTGDDQVRLTLIEDIYATGTDGAIDDFEAPIPTMDFDDPLENEDLVVIDYSQPMDVGTITPILCTEPNIWISKNERRMLAAIQRRSGLVQSFGVGFREVAVGNFINAGVFQAFTFTGTTLDVVPVDGPKIIRQAHDQFRITLNREADAANLLSSASSVQADGDGLDLLTATQTAVMVIGREVWRVGHIEETGANEFTVRVAIRAEFGTDKELHAAGKTFHFFPYFERARMTMPVERLPVGLPVDLAVMPNAVGGVTDPTLETRTFGGESLHPLRPELVRAARSGTTWTLVLRPRIYNGGSGYGPNFDVEIAAREGDVGLHRLRMQRGTGAMLTLPDYFESGSVGDAAMRATRFTFVPTDGTSPETGVWTVDVEFATNPATLTIHSLLGGQISEPLVIPQP